MTNILIVEDDKFDSEITAYYITKLGIAHNIIFANDTKVAYEQLKNNEIIFILCDVGMMYNGVTLLKKIKSEALYYKIPVIMMSGYEQDENLLKREGAVAFMTKPIDVGELVRILLGIGAKVRFEGL